MDAVTQGSCLCDAVNCQVSTQLNAVTHCHCKKCQKSHGAAFATYASAPISAVNINASLDTRFVAHKQAHSCLESKAAWFCEGSV
ncbi:GFA family protein [Pseudomonas antarctica]|uniref:GFA family protein n=1 Tax=Pseudomonas antarctica TaxID=219572 RepID=UPI0039C3AC9C